VLGTSPSLGKQSQTKHTESLLCKKGEISLLSSVNCFLSFFGNRFYFAIKVMGLLSFVHFKTVKVLCTSFLLYTLKHLRTSVDHHCSFFYLRLGAPALVCSFDFDKFFYKIMSALKRNRGISCC
jgi:hypothetical protein